MHRYADGAIIQVGPTTQMVEGIVALLTGLDFGIGDRPPAGYEAYNVSLYHRDSCYYSHEHMYRTSDGYIYQVDLQSRISKE